MKTEKTNEKESEKLRELLKKADGHPMMKAILAEEAAAIMEKRTEAAGKIGELAKEREKVIPRLQTDLTEKEEKFTKAKAALDAATVELNKAKADLSSKRFQFDNAINREKAVLLETADPSIDEAITFFNEKLSFLRSPGRINRIASGSETNLIAWKKTTREESNSGAVKGALIYCQAAIKELEKMKLSPSLDADKIEQMKAGVPSIDIYAQYEGEKSLPKVNADPFAGLASDSELDWKRDKLIEKAKKILKR